jgi:hypothetical protein
MLKIDKNVPMPISYKSKMEEFRSVILNMSVGDSTVIGNVKDAGYFRQCGNFLGAKIATRRENGAIYRAWCIKPCDESESADGQALHTTGDKTAEASPKGDITPKCPCGETMVFDENKQQWYCPVSV